MSNNESPTEQLVDLLRDAGARVVFDRGNDHTHPCTFCGTRPVEAHPLLRIGTYPNGEPIRRPVCSQCVPVVEARAAGAPVPRSTLSESTCPDCLRPSWLPTLNVNFDDSKHCLAAHVRARPGAPNHDLVACLERTRDRFQAERRRMVEMLRRTANALQDAAALVVAEADLPHVPTHEMTASRIERQDRVNHKLRLKLAQLGEYTEEGADAMLVVTRHGRCGGSPTIGHTRLPLAQVISQIRAGETVAGLQRCWPDVPESVWRVCVALAHEVMPFDGGTTLLCWAPLEDGNMPDDDTRVFFWHRSQKNPLWRLKHGYFHAEEREREYFEDDGDPLGSTHIPASEVSHWAPWPENNPVEVTDA